MPLIQWNNTLMIKREDVFIKFNLSTWIYERAYHNEKK